MRAMAPALALLDRMPASVAEVLPRELTDIEVLVDWVSEAEHILRASEARETRAEKGQFFTPWPVARRMAAMIGPMPATLRLLDPGAGFGSLTAAVICELCERQGPTRRVEVVAVELDPRCHGVLARTLAIGRAVCASRGIELVATLEKGNFLELANEWRGHLLFERRAFDLVIANPPYRKINSNSAERRWLQAAHIETSNLYTGFLWLAIELLESRGELVAITPRSFCNGAYFLPFRRLLAERGRFRRIHLFEKRNRAFEGDQVLQENLIFAFQRQRRQGKVTVSTSEDARAADTSRHELATHELIRKGDLNLFIHLPTSPDQQTVADEMAGLAARLDQLDIEVSTGRVVEFRCRAFLREQASADTVPLIFPGHQTEGSIRWPLDTNRPQHFLNSPESARLLLPPGIYVLTRRLSAKEEKRRIVPALFAADTAIAFENHLNVFHRLGGGLPADLARGLFFFLSSSLVEGNFRLFNGLTQVNATDLRSLRYPNEDQLRRLGQMLLPGADQPTIDATLRRVLAE